jgi:hypothetical protein
MTSSKGTPHSLKRGIVALLMPVILLVGACSSTPKSTAQKPTGTGTSVAVVATATAGKTSVPAPAITPISGDYSVYVDPTWGYTFEYPSAWIVFSSVGKSPDVNGRQDTVQESNVDIKDPSAPDPEHPVIQLMIRATNNADAQFVQKLPVNQYQSMCSAQKTLKVGDYPAIDLFTRGGDPVTGYTAPALGRAFFAKGLAFEFWLQGSPRITYDISYFIDHNQPILQHVIDTFYAGAGAQPAISTSC